MTDNGARALAERLRGLRMKPLGATSTAAAILANGAVFLPDAAELDRLRRIEAAARAVVLAARKMTPEIVALNGALARAALQPEGSAGT